MTLPKELKYKRNIVEQNSPFQTRSGETHTTSGAIQTALSEAVEVMAHDQSL
jgi:hypothetical protein